MQCSHAFLLLAQLQSQLQCRRQSQAEMNEPISSRWPLHWQVWHDDPYSLKRLLSEKVYDKEEKDPRGRTPLHLAVTLNRRNCVGVLLSFGANTLALNRHQWTVLHETVSTGDPEMIGMVLCCRDRQQLKQRDLLIPELLHRLVSGPDFYIEMKWEFTSWIPFMSRLTPSDTYRIWKKGAAVRVDTTLIGFQNLQWLRGLQSMLFTATVDGATMVQIDHDKQTIWEEHFKIKDYDHNPRIIDQAMGVARRLSSPIVSTIIDTDSIAFQRQKSGIWGFRSDRSENVNGFDAKVFTATGLNMVTRTRVEHMSGPERQQSKDKSYNPLQGLLATEDDQSAGTQLEPPPGAAAHMLSAGTMSESVSNSSHRLTLEEYFTAPSNPKEYDGVGRDIEVHSRIQQLKTTVWLAEQYPLSLQEQILPVIELMSISDAHFAKVKDFIALQMPAGFPVKFEIPLFHVMSARVTFGNINGHTEPVEHVSLHTDEQREAEEVVKMMAGRTTPSLLSDGLVMRRHSSSSSDPDTNTANSTPYTGSHISCVTGTGGKNEVCKISEEAFTVPDGYRRLNQWTGTLADQEEEMLQLAIRQSMLDQKEEAENVTVIQAVTPPDTSALGQLDTHAPPYTVTSEDSDLELALALSQAMAAENNAKEEEEDEELQRVLRLSLQDK